MVIILFIRYVPALTDQYIPGAQEDGVCERVFVGLMFTLWKEKNRYCVVWRFICGEKPLKLYRRWIGESSLLGLGGRHNPQQLVHSKYKLIRYHNHNNLVDQCYNQLKRTKKRSLATKIYRFQAFNSLTTLKAGISM